jgi:hypothetical protein
VWRYQNTGSLQWLQEGEGGGGGGGGGAFPDSFPPPLPPGNLRGEEGGNEFPIGRMTYFVNHNDWGLMPHS